MSVLTRREVEDQVLTFDTIVGIDLGIMRFETLTDGVVVLPVNALKSKKAKLARAQQRLKRKVKFSKNWKKQQGRIAKIRDQVADVRRDFLQKTSTRISKNHAIVVIDDLKGREHVEVSGWDGRKAWPEREAKVRAEPSHPGTGLGRIPPPT